MAGVRDVRRPAGPSTRTRPTAASTPSRTPARRAARGCGCCGRRRLAGRATTAGRGRRGAAARGAIVAVKGLGGYHLACRADDEGAVAALRARKHREDKPFALMAPDLEAARELVELDAADAALLRRPRAPDRARAARRPGARVAAAVAPRSPDLGVMLPYSPLHHLLLADAGAPLVMTSGNVSDEPIAYRDEDALERLAHDRRPVPRPRPADPHAHRRLGRARRRAAGAAAPAPLARLRAGELPLPVAARRPVLACGAELKSTFCVATGRGAPGSATTSATSKNYETLRSFTRGRRALRAAVRGRARGRRPRPAPRLPLDALRARARGRRARRRAAPPRPPRRVPGRARRDAARRSARSTTAPGSGPTGRSGAASCSSATCAASSAPGTCGRCACPAATRAVREPWRMACAWLVEAAGAEPAAPPRAARRGRGALATRSRARAHRASPRR